MYSILIADDESLIRKGIIARLNYHGFDFSPVLEAEDGRMALEIIKAGRPQIVVTDIKMPNMSGIELLKKACSIYPDTRFIMISGYAEFEYAQDAINMGAKGYILKPISDENLMSIIQKVINEIEEKRKSLVMQNAVEKLKKANELLQFEREINEIFNTQDKISRYHLYRDKLVDPDTGGIYYILAIISICGDKNSGKDFCGKEVKEAVKDIINEVGNEYDARVVNNYRNENELFAILTGHNRLELRDAANKFIDRTFNRIYGCGIGVTVALSDIDSRVCFGIYAQARSVMELRLLYGNNRIYKYGYQNIDAHDFKYPDYKLGVLKKCLDSGNLNSIKEILRDIFSHRVFNGSCKHLNTVYSECVSIILDFCRKRDDYLKKLIPRDVISGDRIYAYNDLDELIQDIYNLIVEILSHGEKNITLSTKNIISMTEQYICEHSDENLTVSGLAQRFLISPNYYSNLFSKEKGMTLTRYITKVRLEKACKLLKETDISISEISVGVGYQDPQYFSRVFKKEMGMTPSEYRESRCIKMEI